MKRDIKAQSELLTIILVILLVLAIVIILWKVVGGAVSKGAENIGAQEKCIGVLMEIKQLSSSDTNRFTIKRSDNKEIKDAVSLIVLVDGKPLSLCEAASCVPNPSYTLLNGITPANADDFKTPYTSATLTVYPAVTQKLEVALKIGENACSSTTYEL